MIDSDLQFPFYYLYKACELHLSQRAVYLHEKDEEAYVETVMKWGKVQFSLVILNQHKYVYNL